MLGYYLKLATRSLIRNRILTALIVLVIGLGIGATMTMITVLHVMSGDPLPGRSSTLYYPHLDASPPGFGGGAIDAGRSFTMTDARNLLRSDRGVHQAVMAGGRAVVSSEGDMQPFYAKGRYTSSDFFEMFGAPFAAGSGWSSEADERRARIVVLNGGLARKLFGSISEAIGEVVILQGNRFEVSGVLRDWHPSPLFYGGLSGDWAFKSEDQFFLPLTTAMALDLPITGGMTCWGNDCSRSSSQAAWLQFWVELDTPEQVAAYEPYLVGYWLDQKAHGRFPRNEPPELLGLMERLQALHLVPSEVRLQVWLAIGFLAVCLFNVIGLVLAKFMRRKGEVGVRRAAGATRTDIFAQLGTEAAILGLAGGVLGLLVTWLGLWLVRQQPDAYAKLAHLDFAMVAATVVLAVIASALAGLVPAWHACRIPPAMQLKVQ